MFGSEMLEIAIGLVFLYVLLSLVCSAVNEFFAGVFNWRSSNMKLALRHLLKSDHDGNGQSTVDNLLDHPLIETLKRPSGRGPNEVAPSYIAPKTFALALLDTVAPSDKEKGARSFDEIRKTVALIQNEKLKQCLLRLIDNASGDTDKVVTNIEQWFDQSMERASGWYKRKSQMVIFCISLLVTVAINADTLMIADTLWRDSGVRTALVAQAEQLASLATPDGNEALSTVKEQLEKREWPIGWNCSESQPHCMPGNFFDWLTKIFGLLLTALAVSLGAPFWFDVLNKLVNLRSAGNKPVPSSERVIKVDTTSQ